MQRVLRLKALIVLVIGISGAGGDARAAGASDLLIARDLLDHANLTMVWQQKLPVKPGEDLSEFVIIGDRLYLRSDRNYLWALDRAKGDIVFSRSIAPRYTPVLGLGSYGDSLISVVGGQLVELSEQTGAQQRVCDLELGIVALPARNSQFFYVSAADRRLHVFRAKDLVRAFKVSPGNESLITTVMADEDMVVFGTDKGNVVSMMPDAPRKLWQFDVPGALAGPVIRDNSSFYFASTDTHVYRVDAMNVTTAALIWRFQTEAVLDRGPRVTDGLVYQYASRRGLTAIDKQTGQAVWSLPDGVDLLAEAGGRAYVITKSRTLTVMDNAAGRRLYAANFAPVTDHASNTVDARLYVADETGRVACLEPVR